MAECLNKELIEKIKDAFARPQVGDVIFSDDEFAEMKEYATEIVRSCPGRKISSEGQGHLFKKALYVLIVHLAKKWGSTKEEEGYFFKSVFDNLFDDPSLTLDKFSNFTVYCRLDGHPWLKDNADKTTRYKQTFLYNAYAPVSTANGFIDIVSNAFFDETNIESGFFDDTYEQNPAPYDAFVKGYAEKLKGTNESSDTVNNLYGGSYKLNAAFRHAFIYDREGMAKLVSRTIGYLKLFYQGDEVYDGSYLSRLVKEHLTTSATGLNVKESSHARAYVDKVRSIKDWYAYYFLGYEKESGAGKLFIRLPLLNLDSLDQYHDLKAILYLNGGRIQTKSLEIRGNDYNPHINSLSLCVQGLLGGNIDQYHFKVTVEDSTGVIFDSKDSLLRDVILFDDYNRKECRERFINPHEHQIMLAYCPQANVSTSFGALAKGSKGPGPFEICPSEANTIHLSDGKKIVFIDSNSKSACRVVGRNVYRLKLDNADFGICDVFTKVDAIEISKSFVFYQENRTFAVKLESIGDDGNSRPDNKPLLAAALSSEKSIVLSSKEYPKLSMNGLHRISLVEVASKKTVAAISYFLHDIMFDCDGNKLCVNGATHVELGLPGEEKFAKFCNVTEEEARYPTRWGTFLINLPRLKYRIEGYKNCDDEFLSLDQSGAKTSHFISAYSSIDGKGDFLSLSNVQLRLTNFYDSGARVFVDDEEVALKDGRYYVGPLLAKSKKSASIFIEIFHHKCLICTVYREEFVNPDGVELSFDELGFHYSISGFVGEDSHYFMFRIYGDEGYLKESEPFADLAGNFNIDGFEPGYFHYSLYRMQYGATWTKGKKLFDTRNVGDGDYRELGDVIPLRFEGKKLNLTKVPSFGKLAKTSIEEIQFISYDDFGEALFQGYLTAPGKKKRAAYFLWRGNTLRLYRDQNKAGGFFYDKKDKTLCDNKKTNECEAVLSVYFEEEED